MKTQTKLKTLVLVGISAVLGAVLCLLVLYAVQNPRRALAEQGYLPLEEFLYLDGYAPELSLPESDTMTYLRSEPQTKLVIDRENGTINKNQYTFSAEHQLLEAGGVLYIQQPLLEQILCRKIIREEDGSFSLERCLPDSWTDTDAPLIAHAGGDLLTVSSDGEVKPHFYTNSLEAFTESYDDGFRLIEADLSLSSDGVLCCTHDWDDGEGVMDAATWSTYAIDDAFTSMTANDLLHEVSVNEDMFLILDLKDYADDEELRSMYRQLCEIAMVRGGESLLSRIVPQIYDPHEYDIIKEFFDWKSIIFTLYRAEDMPDYAVVSFVRDKDDIEVVTMPQERVSRSFSDRLHHVGKLVYTHPVNTVANLYQWMNLGVDGYYTDCVTPDMYRERYGKLKD